MWQFNVVKLFLSYARTLRVGGCLKGSNGIHQKYTQHNDTHYNVIKNNKLVITTFSITKNATLSITIDDYTECRDEAHLLSVVILSVVMLSVVASLKATAFLTQ